MKLHFRTIEKYLKWLLLGWKSSRNIWRKLGCYSDRSTSLPILSCHNLYLREIFWEKKKEGRIIFFLEVFLFFLTVQHTPLVLMAPHWRGDNNYTTISTACFEHSPFSEFCLTFNSRTEHSLDCLLWLLVTGNNVSSNPVNIEVCLKFHDCCC